MRNKEAKTALRCDTCLYREMGGFCDFTPEAMRALSGLGVHIGVSAGSVLYRQGEEAETVSILCEGQVKLSCLSKAGKSLILRVAGCGEVLGLSAVLTETAHEMQAEAITPTRLKVVPRAAFITFMQEYPEAGRRTAKTLAVAYQSTFLDVKRLALCTSAKGRLGKVLLNLAENSSVAGGRLRFQLLLTHTELGELAGLSRETVTRTLAEFRRKGWIAMKGATVEVLCPAELAAEND